MPKPPQNNTTFMSVSFARLIQPETDLMRCFEVEFRLPQFLVAVF